jgi:hypothetical protein
VDLAGTVAVAKFRRTDRIELSLPDEQLSEYVALRPLLRRWPRQAQLGAAIFASLLFLPMIWSCFDPRYRWGGVIGGLLFGSIMLTAFLDGLSLPPRGAQGSAI